MLRTSALRHGAALATAALLSGGLGACANSTVSTSGFKGPSKGVAQRIADFQSNVAGGDDRKICNQDLASAVRARLAGGCARALHAQLGAIDDYELSVKSIAVSGNSATARVRSTWSGRTRTDTLALVKEGGAWRIAALRG
jgi:hypothetical protein